MQVGDTVICRQANGYAFTEGKEYTVLSYEPACTPKWSPQFTWPAYVEVNDDWGHKVHCHAHRFTPKLPPT